MLYGAGIQGLGLQHTEEGFLNTKHWPIEARLKLAKL